MNNFRTFTRKRKIVHAAVCSIIAFYTFNASISLSTERNIISAKQRFDDTSSNPLGNDVQVIHSHINQQHGQQPIKILSLGGSITWGSKLDSRTHAYPHVITKSDNVVCNLAVRATGSDYASHCIQSMIEIECLEQHLDIDIDFDVIFLEYSLNGLENLTLLLNRLRKRYPHATFIYIHLYSPKMMIKDERTGDLPRDIMNRKGLKFREIEDAMVEFLSDGDARWVWDDIHLERAIGVKEEASTLISSIGGFIYSFPLQDDPETMFQFFAEDGHHLNAKGHSVVAKGLREILMQISVMTIDGTSMSDHGDLSPSGTWGKGDQCHSWFETGVSPLEHNGGQLKMFVKPDKYAHEISLGSGESSIKFENKSKWPMPLYLIHMVWKENVYPKAKVTILSYDSNEVSGARGGVEVQFDKRESIILNPIHPREGMRVWHVSYLSQVGYAQPGRNVVSFECVEKTERPLRITGLAMCGACEEMEVVRI